MLGSFRRIESLDVLKRQPERACRPVAIVLEGLVESASSLPILLLRTGVETNFNLFVSGSCHPVKIFCFCFFFLFQVYPFTQDIFPHLKKLKV